MKNPCLAVVAVLCLLGAQAPDSSGQPILRIDLLDPAADFSDLPEITQEELDALRRVAGPGPDDLGRRLRSTGIASRRLRAWAPYLILRGDTGDGDGSFSQQISMRQSGRASVRSRMRWTEGAITADAVLTGSSTSARDVPGPIMGYGLFEIRLGRASRINAGAFIAGVSGPDPWEDPMRTGVLGRGDGGSLLWRGLAGARGAGISSGAGAVACWDEARLGRGGILVARPSSRISAWAGMSETKGYGGSIVFRSGTRSASLAFSAPRALPPAIRVMTSGGSRWYLHMARSLGTRADGRETRSEFGLSGSAPGLHGLLRVAVGGDSARSGSRSALYAVAASRRVRLEGSIRESGDRLLGRYEVRSRRGVRAAAGILRERQDGVGSTRMESEIAWEGRMFGFVASAFGSPGGPVSPSRIRAIRDGRRTALALSVSWSRSSRKAVWILELKCRASPTGRR